MNYIEQLNSEEWRVKRKKILERDLFTCHNCNNNTFITAHTPKIREIAGRSFYLANAVHDGRQIFTYFRYGSIKPMLNTLLYCKETGNHLFTERVSMRLYEILLVQEQTNDRRWLYYPGLNVHHNYYQEGLLAWEYPNDALITYCQECHEELHRQVIIPKLDKNGLQVGQLTACWKCSGTGYLPQFPHVENGICFECKGSCYEELKER